MEDTPDLRNRSNTLLVDLAEAYHDKVVPHKEWIAFISKDLKVSVDELYGATYDSDLILQFNTEEQYQNYEAKLRSGVQWSLVDKLVYGWSAQEKISTVRITGYSSKVIPIPTLIRKFAEYGEVVSHREGFLRELPSVRDFSLILRMRIRPGTIIPSILNVTTLGETPCRWQTSCSWCRSCSRRETRRFRA